ncbi:hypothetical protein [Azospirillum rugosum]|uniref:Uncharacterized protein n=1 Tax=Azospirillum rugosum TaxID=416170 RepID=A0ABS4SSV5_9PROT|nr:hypothetical protein [Azospirillum rugosum]MBP2295644.1 hypothetical protein [Azospirillum rugosum]MDQ0529466.1 hypothetical protein [Azospirillum rugosum]
MLPKHRTPNSRPAVPLAAMPFEAMRVATAAWLVSGAPFFWAPPLWILALMAPHRPKGGSGGSTASPP